MFVSTADLRVQQHGPVNPRVRYLVRRKGIEMDYLKGLDARVMPLYASERVTPGHGEDHVRRMIAMGLRIKEATGLEFDLEEYHVAVVLHNLDRSVKKVITGFGSLEAYAQDLLRSSSFAEHEKARIVDAVVQHSKKDDEPGDSPLLTALRIADKLDRLGPLGVMALIAHASSRGLPCYDPEQPFGYESTVEDRMNTIYDSFFRTLEWVGMLPSDEARSLINKDDLRAYIEYLRALGRQIARECGVENRVEDDIYRALGGTYYTIYAR